MRNGCTEHLILRRSESDPLCPGAWQVITGGMRSGESAADAAARELKEETGLTALRWIATGRTATFFFEPFDATVHSPILLCEISDDADLRLSLEHIAHRWCTASQAIGALTFETHRDGVALVADITSQSR